MSSTARNGRLGRWSVVVGLSAAVVAGASVLSLADGPEAKVVRASQKVAQKKKGAPKAADAAKDGMMDGAAKADAKKAAPAEGSLSFKTDIAPILVANCRGCHTGNGQGIRNSKLDMTTFEKLMAGGKRGPDIVAGDPDASTMILMIRGEETPRMPPRNGQRGFADEAGEKIAAWIKQGARLDAGLSPTDPIDKYAATLDDLRKAELAKLSPEERDRIVEEAAKARWKKATKVEPELTTTKTSHFLILSTLPKERALRTLQAMDRQFELANKVLSTNPRTPVLPPTEKIGLYVFKDSGPFAEFVRAVENQDIESDEQARARFNVESPYIVAVDPAAGGEELSTAVKKATKKKKAEETFGPERTLPAVLTEQLFAGAAAKAGKPPRWVALGLGALMASKIDPASSPYYAKLRRQTMETVRIGWQAKANEALGGQATAEVTRAVGFSLFECISASYPGATLGNFIHVMLGGQEKLDEAIGDCLNLNRQEFLQNTELWISERYGAR